MALASPGGGKSDPLLAFPRGRESLGLESPGAAAAVRRACSCSCSCRLILLRLRLSRPSAASPSAAVGGFGPFETGDLGPLERSALGTLEEGTLASACGPAFCGPAPCGAVFFPCLGTAVVFPSPLAAAALTLAAASLGGTPGSSAAPGDPVLIEGAPLHKRNPEVKGGLELVEHNRP